MPQTDLARANLADIVNLSWDDFDDFKTYIQKKNNKTFNEFVILASQQLAALRSLAEKEASKKMQEQMDKEIAYMIPLFRAIINNVYMYNDHLKCGAQEAMESIQYRIIGLQAMMENNEQKKNENFTASMLKAKAALTAHNAAVKKGDELSSEDFKDAAFKMTMVNYGLLAILILSGVILGLASFGIAPLVAGGIALIGLAGAFITSTMYVVPQIKTNTFNQHEVEVMESACKNSVNKEPGNSASHMSSLLDGGETTEQPVLPMSQLLGSDAKIEPPVSPVSDQSLSEPDKTQPGVNHTIQNDEKVKVEETQNPKSPTV